MKKLILIMLMALLSFSVQAEMNLIIDGESDSGETTKLSIEINEKTGEVTRLSRDKWHFIEEYIGSEYVDEIGFDSATDIPRWAYNGKCDDSFNGSDYQCSLRVNFTDEEVTTIFIHFTAIYNYHGYYEYSGALFETHSDQGMVLYNNSFLFHK